MNLRVTGVGPIARPALLRIEPGDGNPARARTGSRPVCFGRGEEFVPAAIFARSGLMAGDVIAGPAVIEEYGATVPLHPGFRALVDEQGNLRISRELGVPVTRSLTPSWLADNLAVQISQRGSMIKPPPNNRSLVRSSLPPAYDQAITSASRASSDVSPADARRAPAPCDPREREQARADERVGGHVEGPVDAVDRERD